MSAAPADGPLADAEIEELAAAFDRLPDTAEIFDVQMADGYLAGALLQPEPVPAADCLPRLLAGAQAGAEPAWPADELPRIAGLLLRRYNELAYAIGEREPFEPIVFPFVDEASGEPDVGPQGIEALAPWAVGFALALEDFPALVEIDDEDGLLGDLLLGIFRHIPAGSDTEDAAEREQMLAELPPLESLQDAMQDIIDCTLEIADISRPRAPLRRAEPKVGRNEP
jgi:uncharacterized protein